MSSRSYAFVEVEGETIDLNQSRLQVYSDCIRKFWYIFERRLEKPKGRFPLIVGTAAHKGLEVLNGGEEDVAKILQAAALKFDEVAKKGKFHVEERPLVESFKQQVLDLLSAYVEHWGGTKEEWTVLHPEVEGRVEIGTGTNVFLDFRTDAIVSWRRSIFLLEHKTAAKNDPRDELKYEVDLQLTAYIYAVSKLLGIKVDGAVMNMLVKTKVPQFSRFTVFRSEEQLQLFEGQFVDMAREILWRRRRVRNGENPNIVWRQNTRECFRYGECQYRALCLRENPATLALYEERDPDYVDIATNPALAAVSTPAGDVNGEPRQE